MRRGSTILATGILFLLASGGLNAQTNGQSPPNPTAAAVTTEATAETKSPATSERIDELQKRVEASTDLSETDKKQITDLLQQALSDLEAARQADQQALVFEKKAAAIETDRAKLEKELSQPVEPATNFSGKPVTELETNRVETEAKIKQFEQDLKQPTADPAARSASRKSARTLVTELPVTLSDVEQDLATPPPDGEGPLLTEARKLALEVRKQMVQARLNAAQKELAQFDAADAVNLPTLRRESYTRQLNAAQKQLEALNAEINRQRQMEAERRAQEARQAAINAQPQLRGILEESQEIIRDEQELRSRHEEVKQLLQRAEERTREIDEDALEAERLDREVGLEKMGVWLRKQRESLQDVATLDAQLTEHTDHLVEAEFEFYERKDQLDELADIEARADELVTQAELKGEAELNKEDAIQVLRSQAVNLDKLVEEYRAYTETLAQLDKQHELLMKEADEYSAFLDERILWIRSHLPITFSLLREDGETLAGVFNPQAWLMGAKTIAWDAVDHWMLYLGVAALLAYLWFRRSRHSHQLEEIAKQASGRVTTSMMPTLHCLVLTIWLAIPWPGLILFVAWRLRASSISDRIAVADLSLMDSPLQIAAMNLARLASVAFLLEFVRQSIRSDGLAQAHFDWNGKTLRRVRRLTWSVVIFGLPLAAVVACLHLQDPGSRRDTIERLFFVGAMVVLIFFAHGLLHPSRGALRQTRVLQGDGWVDRLDYLWYLLGIGVPLALAGFAVLGYYDTAVKLATKVQQTAWVVVAGIYLHALLLRWLMLRHRRLRIMKARERLAAAQTEPGTSPESGAPMPDVDTNETDLESINQQSRRLVSTSILVLALGGMWLLWADVLPAIRFLDRWPLWDYTEQVTRIEVDPETGESQPRTDVEVNSVTIASLVQVLIIIVLTTTATRNLPGMLEISVLQRLPIDRSTAYAITSLTRYALVLIGLILASQALGIGWSKVQWLAAALTFGLGFGLQEIFANFVSGVIILFEQPVRVGDVVTIDGVSGVVNRIRIRATTIVDWDRKEYIVPNREFITGRLLNWTLSDKMNRIVINVGVAYGSDTDLVRKTIMQVLDEHENVLADPAPLVTFESFGDSSLNFVVRAYLPNLDQRLETIHQLHSAIHNRLAATGIEIPFPQRDLHLRSNVVVERPERGRSSGNGQAEESSREERVGSGE